MRILDTAGFSKEIHFPISRAVYKVPPQRNWYQKIVKFLTYRRWDEVIIDYILWIPALNSYIFIPASFLSDGASVPKALNGLFSTNGMLLLGALPHDFGYRYKCLILVNEMTGELYTKSFTKSELDEVFESLCVWESGFKKASTLAKYTLTVAGFIGWNENRKANHVLNVDFPGLFAEIFYEKERTEVRKG